MPDRTARNLLIALTIAVAVTRFFALSHSMWDWDEAQFSSGVRHYNVAQHHPHPPGFPLYIAAAKCVRLFVHDDFRALRTLNLIVSLFLFPIFFALGRSFGFSFRTSAVGALLYAFLPNVVFWGGTGMSDMSAAVVFAAGAALLLRDDAAPRSFIAGTVVLAASMLIRPQNVIGAYPWLVGAFRQFRAHRRRGVATIAAGGVLAIAIVAAGYGLAAWKTGWQDYISATSAHQQYVSSVDGFRNPDRLPSLSPRMLWLYVVKPVKARGLPVFAALAALALFLPRRAHLHVLGTYGPQMLFVLFMLNPGWVSRFAIAYMPAHAFLASSALEFIATAAARRRERASAAVHWLAGAAGALLLFAWVWPAIREVRLHDSPPVEATRWVLRHLRPENSVIYAHSSMAPYVDYFLGGYHIVPVEDDFEHTYVPSEANAYFLIGDYQTFGADAIAFRRPRLKHLTGLYGRYYEASIAPASARFGFGAGWYREESDGENVWRWMGKSAHLTLQSTGKPARLTIRMYAPIDAVQSPTLTVRGNGTIIDRYTITSEEFERRYDLTVAPGTRYDVSLEVDRTVVPKDVQKGGDARELGLKLRSVSWRVLP